ncbi:enoyl-CoA hydratase-related protein [Rhodococcus sp. LB1]|uniref:enoyl-CoA hydratase-related protein n=1 Tax=Rhodococcus sp. LB1 TaxID=1807499 RepID=UPI000779FD9F|nr:enoyl-CoA hydratase-related protein [Rhodococcus sp. LB1]KXX58450.1 enoyl-CoA hydratase [Rhodococcus sp. LB1]
MTVRVDRRGPVATFTFDRLTKRNAFDAAMTAALDSALNDFEDDDSLRVGIITGGTEAFSAGTDVVSWAGEPTPRGGPYGVAGRTITKPLIAAVEGIAAGGGFEIALSATMIVASTASTFSFPEVKLGLIAECGGLFRGPRALPLNVARELLLTGGTLSATRAYALGLVNRLTVPGEALSEALELATSIATVAPIAVRQTLEALEALHCADDEIGWNATDRAKEAARGSADALEGVAAFKERRSPRWTGR